MDCLKFMKIILLALSLLLYAFFGLNSLIFILFSLLSSFFLAQYLAKHKNKKIFILSLFLNAIIFIVFKLFNGEIKGVIAPLGLAYYTLQVISYLVDIYQDKYNPEKNLINYALYIFYFPCLFLGPIKRYNEFQKALNNMQIKARNIGDGLIRICWGLFKKLVIAGRVSIIIASLTKYGEGGAYTLNACLWYSLLLYADFSGGIDIVLGFSHIFNLELPENFDRPYFTESIKEFWQHWHMSLTSFLKTYIYIPLGGNKKGKIRQKINILITFLVSAFWHGTSYLGWGLCHGLFVAFPKALKTKWPHLNRLITFLIVSILWIFFIYEDTFTSLKMLLTIFTHFNYGTYFANFFNYGLNFANYLVLFSATLILFLYEKYQAKIKLKLTKLACEKKIIIIGSLILIILLFGIYGLGFEVSEFIYSKF